MQRTIARLLARLQAQPSHTGSVIVTIFGDAIAPRGGAVALSSIIAICADFGIGSGVVRTAMSRLLADGWFITSRRSRASFYRITPSRQGEIIRASRHIFGPTRRPEISSLNLIFPEAGRETGDDLTTLRARLNRLGFVQSQGFMLAPAGPLPRSVTAAAPLLRAEGDPPSLRALANRAWRLDVLASRYVEFCSAYRNLAQIAARLPPREALIGRLLLVHEYRRIVLRDPRLPPAFLPDNWPGHAARALCARLYPALLPSSERRLDSIGHTETGPLPAAEPGILRRFQDS